MVLRVMTISAPYNVFRRPKNTSNVVYGYTQLKEHRRTCVT